MKIYILSDPMGSQLLLTTDPDIVVKAREFAAEAAAELEVQEWDTTTTSICRISLNIAVEDEHPLADICDTVVEVQ